MKVLKDEKPITHFKYWDPLVFAKGNSCRMSPMMVFDWESAAREIVNSKTNHAQAALQGDFDHTLITIFKNNKVINQLPRVIKSTWATPVLIIKDVIYECFSYEGSLNYVIKKCWPKCALKIIKEGTNEVFNSK